MFNKNHVLNRAAWGGRFVWMVGLRRLFILLIKVERWGQKHFSVKCFLQIFSRERFPDEVRRPFKRRALLGTDKHLYTAPSKRWRTTAKELAAGNHQTPELLEPVGEKITFHFHALISFCLCLRFLNNVQKKIPSGHLDKLFN